MRKQLLSIISLALMCMTFQFHFAQNEGSKIFLPKSMTKQQNAKLKTPSVNVASCGPDTIVYPYLKELVFAAPNDSFFIDAMVGNVRTASQGYMVSDTVDVLGIQFWGGAYSATAFPQTMPVVAYLYSVDASFMPDTIIDSAFVTVTETYDFYEAMFTSPVPVGTNFAVAVKNVLNDTLAVITNNAGNVWSVPGYGESLAWRRFGSGAWNSSASFFGQDLEYMIWPIVQYEVEASFTATADTLCTMDSVMFTNTTTGIFSDRMFNLYAFDDYWGFSGTDSTFWWNYGDNATWSMDTAAAHAYSAGGTYTVSLTGQITGYYTSCADTATMTITVPDLDLGATFTNDTLWSADSSATYQWMECNGDTMISGATGQFHIPTFNGDYAVIVSKMGCTDTSACVNVSTVGIKKSSDASVTIFPNPAHENITVNTGNTIPSQIIVTNALGEIVHAIKPATVNTTIDLSGLKNAVYFVKVMNTNSYKVVKVIKQ